MRRGAALSAVTRWVDRCGVQVRRGALAGAFNAWYDLEARRFAYVYPEITGYGITTLLYLDSLTSRHRRLARARQAGDWVLDRALHPDGGIRPRDYFERQERSPLFAFERHLSVSFDSGMVLFGLTNLFAATRDVRYRRGALKVGSFLTDQVQKKDGWFHACLVPVWRGWEERLDKWSAQSGPFHAKLAMGLIQLSRVTGEARFARAGAKACERSLKAQRPNGRFVCYRADGSTHMHPHMYAAEGLLWAGLELGRAAFVRSAARAAAWALSVQEPDGGMPCRAGERPGQFNRNQRSDILAQVLRLATVCQALGALPRAAAGAMDRLERRLLSFQNVVGPQAGGFRYGAEMNGESRNHVNFWCSAFALQALAMRREATGRVPSMGFFI
ncbi:MAG: hypothetical protein A3J74_01485 [Elusimicrobia bacterium RIFCSPHIGHO2_02_FULL_57_9]|nr:MAG: hypothetical protein A3J74_01485 [Elusimicrobia bacterium RIFCSPHIGHO2_02_FULL_57_9]